MHTLKRYLQAVSFNFLSLLIDTSGFTQTKPTVSELSLEEGFGACGMAVGQDGMFYVLSSRGGRYDMGTLSRLNPEAFSRLQRGKDERNHALPEDFTEVYVFGQPA